MLKNSLSFHLILQDVAAYQLLGPTYNGTVVGEAHNQGLYNESHTGEGKCAFVSCVAFNVTHAVIL